MAEQRKKERKNLSYYLPVSDVDSTKQIGILVDISPEGFKLDSPEPIPDGQVCHFRLYLTNAISTQDSLVFSGRSKWCRPDYINPSTYNVGFELVDMSPEDAQLFQNLFEKYGSKPQVFNSHKYPWK